MRCVACRLSGRARVMRDPDRRAAAATEPQRCRTTPATRSARAAAPPTPARCVSRGACARAGGPPWTPTGHPVIVRL